MAVITNTKVATLISGTNKNDYVMNYADNVTYSSGSTVTISTGSGNDSVENSADSHNALIDTGKGNDTIYNDGSKVTINGGAGNDSLVGGKGKDTIFDYTSGDMLKILKSNGKTGSFSKSKFSGGTLSLTISGGGNVIFNNVTASTEFNINSTIYTISGSKLIRNS